MVEHFLNRRAQFAFLDDAAALHAEAFGDLHEIRIKCAGIVGAADIVHVAENRVAPQAAVEAVLPLHHHAEVLVI